MNIEHFKQRLLAKERELMADIPRLKDEARTLGEAEVRDATDDATSSQEASESLLEESVATTTLQDVRDALRRIEEGTYGKCLDCGRPIEPARLEAIPGAAYCIADQEKRDARAHLPQSSSTL